MGFLDKFKKKPKTSPGGSPIYRYEKPEEDGWRPPAVSGVYAEEVTAHMEALFPGRESFVFHEIVSDLVHIDVTIMRPKEAGDPYVLYTTGMSDLPMTLPDEINHREELKYAELVLFLPGSWNFGQELGLDRDLPPEDYWPIGTMKFLARFPHEYKTWLGWGHTIPNGPEYDPLGPNVGFGGVVLDWMGEQFQLETEDGKTIHLLYVVPAYREEIEYKLKYGMEKLREVFAKAKMPLVLDIHRPNHCADFTEILDGPEN